MILMAQLKDGIFKVIIVLLKYGVNKVVQWLYLERNDWK